MIRDRYGEDLAEDALELHPWEGIAAHHLRVARTGLPPRAPELPAYGTRRVGLKATMRARRVRERRSWR